jgi:hypothetical protein
VRRHVFRALSGSRIDQPSAQAELVELARIRATVQSLQVAVTSLEIVVEDLRDEVARLGQERERQVR